MSEQDELLLTKKEVDYLVRYPLASNHIERLLKAQLAKAKQHYEHEEYDPQAVWMGRFLDAGWIPPGEQKRLDRPELRKGMKEAVEKAGRVKPYPDTPDVFKCFYDLDVLYNELVALIPDCEQKVKEAIDTAIGAYESTCEGLIEEAKKQERERIMNKLELWGRNNYGIVRPGCEGWQALKETEGGKECQQI